MRLLEPWPLKFVIDGVIAEAGADGVPSSELSLQTVLILACAALLVVVALRALSAYLMTVCFALVGNRMLTRVRAELYAHLQRLSMAFHDKAGTGDLVQRVTADVGRLKEVAVTAGLPLLGNLATLVGMVAVVAIMDWQLALVMLGVFPLFALIGVRLSRRINTVSRTQRKAEGALATRATEVLSAMQVVQSYSLEERMQREFDSSNTKTLKDGVKAKKLAAGLERKTDVLVGIATAVVLFVGAQRVLAGALTPGELVVFLTYLKAAFKPMRDLAKYTGRIASATASAERIADVMGVQPEIRNYSWARPAGRFTGEVRFENVWLSYVPGRPVLRGVNLHVRAGERVAIVGPSGSGKSTLVLLLSRLTDPDTGQVTIDGQDLRDLTVETVRSQVATVLQDSVLFATTIAENIAHGVPEATQDQVEAAARLAGAHEFILNLPQGYDTVVAERGSTLSGGQRQRIAIARAAIRDASVIVLDEAMAGLDTDTEREVSAAMDRLTEGRTTLVVTHDLAAAARADRVVQIEHGRATPSPGALARQTRKERAGATTR
ncbi:MAG TPA: ABC transporter ATP-binding protein/permease [Candidatus Ruania gallistercoris]|uniref:ABC transporter ATP-binding protein/permease n=1 Tax=Candidatus Ruania gallistercoris TaxID=2838746 RepID=A0A9D2EII5_9MICO|nr:ABC transporter ATP-binding protein/permease [Candidatus Ruania gallistercoris]